MNMITDAFEQKIAEILRNLLLIEDDIELNPTEDLVSQIGLDSIEAFDAVAALHEIIGQAIPTDFNPKVSNSIRLLAEYIKTRFGQEGIDKIMAIDATALSANANDDALAA